MSGERTGKAADLEGQFEEILTEFAHDVCYLITGGVIANPEVYNPDVEKTKQRLLDVVSNTLILDPH